jgi:hypothetical protein
VGAFPISVLDPFLVVGIPAPSYPAVDISTLFLHSHVCGCDVPVVRVVFSRADGGLRQLQSLLLFPTTMDIQLDDYSVLADILDTFIKGSAFWHAIGPFYYVRTGLYILLSAAAIKIKYERFHAGFAIFATASEIVLILKSYMTLN